MEHDVKEVLPRHVLGELKMLKRRAAEKNRLIAQLEAINNVDVDTSVYQLEEGSDKYYNRWLEKAIERGMYDRESGGSFHTMAFQSCWPEESSNMLFQFLYEELGIRFKWWSRAYNMSSEKISIVYSNPEIIEGALPNINATMFECPGDYGEKLSYGNKISRMRELYNYTSSPNLRESNRITSIYSALAVSFQYCDVQVKRNGIEETTSIAKIMLEIYLNNRDLYSKICRKQCNHCKYNEETALKWMMCSKGEHFPTDVLKLYQLVKTKRTLVHLLNDFDTSEIETMVKLVRPGDQCDLCIFYSRVYDETFNTYEMGRAVASPDYFMIKNLPELIGIAEEETDQIITEYNNRIAAETKAEAEVYEAARLENEKEEVVATETGQEALAETLVAAEELDDYNDYEEDENY